MRLTLKDSFFRMLFPLIGVATVLIIFNLGDLTSKLFFEIFVIGLSISFLGGTFIYTLSFFYDKYEFFVIDKIQKRYQGEKLNLNTIKFTYKNIIVLFNRKENIRLAQNEFSFHVPRKYIPKQKREKMTFIKPSRVFHLECFQLRSWFYINEKKINEI
ncbi:MAG TPA: hypothetical protein PJ990_15900 [Saprospiraceae bacterium]|nr:hypothetical protein [Saprospiraceae bacterium]